MVAESSHFQVPKYLMVQLDVADQDEFYVVSSLRLSPDVVSVINTPEKKLSQIPKKHLVKSKTTQVSPILAESFAILRPSCS